MKIVNAEDLEVGDEIRVGWDKFVYPQVTKVEIRENEVWTEWSDGVKIPLPPSWQFQIMEDSDPR